VHFAILTNPGPADDFYRPVGDFIVDLFRTHQEMFASNVRISVGHPDASPWWMWPFMMRPLFYWIAGKARIYFIGNPVVWWSAGVGVVMLFLSTFVVGNKKRKSEKDRRYRAGFALAGYAISLFPYIPVHRVLFLYTYLPAFVFSILALVFWLDGFFWENPEARGKTRPRTYVVVGLVIVGFLLVAPLTFGLAIPTPASFLVPY
jgi:dolichyl-phosphate-mannose--protein O-mannosyl transferase